ncbi:MAG: signal peptidase I [Bacilli bacterium]|nr:signal peptidase I [Bacilli bacterium]
MDSLEIISLIVTIVGTFSFSAIFTILYKSYATSSITEIKMGKRDVEIISEVIYERKESVRRRKSIIKTIKGVFFYLTLFIIIPLFVFSLINKFTGNKMMLGNKTMMVVMSGSMSEKNEVNDYLVNENLNDQFNTYDIIILEKIDPSRLKVNDIIAFRNDKGINVIHRIRKRVLEDGEVKFVTRGDANKADDEYHSTYDDVIGQYKNTRITNIGVFIVFLQSYAGIITVVSIVYCMIMIDRLSEKINKVQSARAKQIEEVIDYSLEENAKKFSSNFKSTINFEGYAYVFDETGFLYKSKIEEEVKEDVSDLEMGDAQENDDTPDIPSHDESNENKNDEQGD